MLSKIIKVLFGVVFIGLGVWTICIWWGDVLGLIRGGLGFVLILAGLIAFALLD